MWFVSVFFAGLLFTACKKANPYQDHLNASRIKIITEPGVLEALSVLGAGEGGAFLLYADTSNGRHVMRVGPELDKIWSLTLPALSTHKVALLEMEDHSLLVVGGGKSKNNAVSWYHISTTGTILKSEEIIVPISGASPGYVSASELVHTKDKQILLLGSVETENGSAVYDYATQIPFTCKLDLNFKVVATNSFYIPIPNVSHALYNPTGLSPFENGQFLVIGDIRTNYTLSDLPYNGFFSCILDRDGRYVRSKNYQTGLTELQNGNVNGFAPQAWHLFPEAGGHFKTVMTPNLNAVGTQSDQRCRVAHFDPEGNYLDSMFFVAPGYLFFNDAIAKPDGGFIVVGAGKYPSFGVGVNFKKEGLFLNVSQSGEELQFLQPAYVSSNSFVSFCQLHDGRLAMFGDVLNPQDRQINLILIKLDENGLY